MCRDMIRIRGGRSQAGPNRNIFAERENVVFFKHFEKANELRCYKCMQMLS